MSAIYDMAGSLWHSMRADYEAALEREFQTADDACHGYLVNRQGKAAGITGRSLFTGSAARAYRYASRELLDYWQENDRLTLDRFEQQWLDARLGSEIYA